MIKTVLDTNTLVSALHFGGKPAQVLQLAIKGRIQNVISDGIRYGQDLGGVSCFGVDREGQAALKHG